MQSIVQMFIVTTKGKYNTDFWTFSVWQTWSCTFCILSFCFLHTSGHYPHILDVIHAVKMKNNRKPHRFLSNVVRRTHCSWLIMLKVLFLARNPPSSGNVISVILIWWLHWTKMKTLNVNITTQHTKCWWLWWQSIQYLVKNQTPVDIHCQRKRKAPAQNKWIPMFKLNHRGGLMDRQSNSAIPGGTLVRATQRWRLTDTVTATVCHA